MASVQARLDLCVEQAFRATVDDGDFEPFDELLMALEQLREEWDVFATDTRAESPPTSAFVETSCGT